MNAASHPDPAQLTAYVMGQLTLPERKNVTIHLESCPTCHARVAAIDTAVRSSQDDTVSDAPASRLPKIAGHELLRELARGGLGVVYLARHLQLKDLRAIKRPLARDGLDRAIMQARFQREVEAVGSLRHDHVVRAHDAGADAEGPYLVMEYLDGQPLSRLVAGRRLQCAEACELVRHAALGLQAAHERGLVHRDVKPSNLVLARAGSIARVVVIDWGLVKKMEEPRAAGTPSPSDLTSDGAAMGTGDYIAPEQVHDARSVDIRADIYSLGVTLYSLLAGKPPFHDRRPLEKPLAHVREEFPPIESARADVPVELRGILKKMVAKDPAQRFASPTEVAKVLKPFCCAESRLVDLLDGKQSSPPAPPTRRRIGCTIAIAAGLLVGAVTLGLIVLALMPPNPSVLPSPGVLGDGPALPVCMSEKHLGQCSSIAFLADGLHAVSEDGGGAIVIWDLQKRSVKKTIPHQLEKPLPNLAGTVAVSPDGQFIAAAGINVGVEYMDLLSLYDQKSCQRANKDYRFTRLGQALAFSPDGGKLAAVDLPGVFNQFLAPVLGSPRVHLKILDISSGKWQAIQLAKPPNAIAYSPDAKFVMTCSDEDKISIWNLGQQRIEREFPAHMGGTDQVAFSADGKQIYSTSSADDTIRIWNNDKETKESRKIVIAGKMSRCAFWPGGRALTGHVDGTVVLWDLREGKELTRFSHPNVQITALAISPDGHHALAAHSDRCVYLYRLPPPRAKP